MNSPSGAAEREAFQAWAESRNLPTSYMRRVNTGISYFNRTTNEAWKAWQAASAGRNELVEALELARKCMEPITGEQIRVHRLPINAADRIDAILAKHKGV